MKEGYIQNKMADLNEQLKQMKNNGANLGLHLEHIEQKIEGYDIILEKLKNIEKFSNEMMQALRKNNEELFHAQLNAIYDKLQEMVDVSLRIKIKDINSDISNINKQFDFVDEYTKYVERLICISERESYFLKALMKQLVKKNIFTNQEINQIIDNTEKKYKKK